MKIAVIAGFAPSILGFRKTLVLELRKRAEVTIFAPYENMATTQSILSLGVDYQTISFNSQGTNPLADLRAMYQLFRKLNNLKINCVLSYTIKPIIWGSFAAYKAGIPHIYSMITGLGYAFTNTSTIKQKFIHHLAVTLYRKSLRYNQAVFFQNQDDLNLFQKLNIIPATKKTILLNGSGVDLSYYQYSTPLSFPMRFLMIARLLKDKGINEYITAAEIVKSRYPEVEFHLVGWIDSNPSAISQSMLDHYIRKGVIIFHGRLQDVRNVLKNCHVFVLPSYREGVPVSVLEAMATGRAIITTDAPGCRETVQESKNGFLVPVKDIKKLSESMIELIKNPHLVTQMGSMSRRIAEERYDVHKVNQHILTAMGLR